jgi:hypothetical protein
MSYDIRNIPIELNSGTSYSSSGAAYGGSSNYSAGASYSAGNSYSAGGANYESSSYSSAGSAIDANLLQHENPNNCTDLAPALPLDQYRLNVDNNPTVIRRKAQEKVQYLQEIAVRYLKPPAVPRGGDIIIQQQPSRQIAPAPALVVRQPGQRAPTPPPLIVREAPPQPPQPLPGKTITIPGKVIPPPARKVIVEKLPSQPAKPQNVLIERWLPYGQQSQRVVYQPARPPCVIPDPKNIVIEWQNPDVEIKKEFKNLGVIAADPRDYVSRYGSSLVRSDALPQIAIQYSNAPGVTLAANSRIQEGPIIEGDVNALKLIDLDKHGLGYLSRSRSFAASGASFGGSLQNLSAESSYSSEQYSSSSAAAAASYSAEGETQFSYSSGSPINYESERIQINDY